MNLEGKSFGRLTVVRKDPTNRRRWECLCSCGTTTLACDSNLTLGKTASCGCLNREANTIPVGTRFHRLVVLGVGPDRKEAKRRRAQSRCMCDCGTEAFVTNASLLSDRTKSCGCLAKERATNWRKTHGLHATGTYSSWSAMMKRCYNPKAFGYRNYGGRGIKVCERWHDCVAFMADVGERPEGHSIDRIDSNRGYEPGNVRWASRKEQNNNRRGVNRHSVFGEMLTVGEMADKFGIKPGTIAYRMKAGKTPEEAVSK